MSDTRNELKELYPFLHGKKDDATLQGRELLASIEQKSNESVDTKKRFFSRNSEFILEISKTIARVFHQRGRMFTMGNGGSSCDANHFAVEFQHPVTAGRPALPAISLVTDNAMISAVSNDVGYKHVFVRQLEALATEQDGLIGFSTSGNSENLIEGYRKAKELGMTTIGFTGGNGGLMKESEHIDLCLVVESDSIHRVQEVHLTTYHIIWDLVHTMLASQRGKLGRSFEQ